MSCCSKEVLLDSGSGSLDGALESILPDNGATESIGMNEPVAYTDAVSAAHVDDNAQNTAVI